MWLSFDRDWLKELRPGKAIICRYSFKMPEYYNKISFNSCKFLCLSNELSYSVVMVKNILFYSDLTHAVYLTKQ